MTIWKLIKKSYKEIYKNIFSIIAVSTLWFFSAGISIIASYIGIKAKFYFPIIIALFVVGPVTAQAFYITNKIINYHTIRFVDFWDGLKKYFFKSIAITWLLGIIVGIITVDFNFFLQSQSKLGKVLIPIYIYILIFLAMLVMYIFPLMIELSKLGEKNSIVNLFKYAFVLVFKNMVYTLLIFLHLITFGLVNIFLVIALPVLFIGGISLFANNATVNLLVKHNIKTEVNGPYQFE
ncbi:DUF624 domain-containing protein [Orenia marismortui]|uniref:Putative membrane protein YesL n=1 Tax=Orenia marismortui TaxID=46469 RepID=A0A4R8H025_9FIRM|nr:DUF624 domain-containing protein [Orenia marismortui]TDX52510.1 putative membrane protein YesL [Orenia marismortui]